MSTEKYEDIINLPYRKSTRHPQMSMSERAAQFSPFAALTGFGNVIERAGGNFHAADIEYDDMDESWYQGGEPEE